MMIGNRTMNRPKKLTARVAPYLEAIASVRAAGWGWPDIAAIVAPSANPNAVRSAVKKCKYRVEQLPLPEPEPEPAPVVRRGNGGNGSGNGNANVTPAPAQPAQQTVRQPRRLLPGELPVGDGDAMLEMLAAKGIKVT